MNQLTVRGLDKDLDRRIRRLAAQERTSLNKAALHLMRRGAGMDPGASGPATTFAIGDRLDDFIGSWSAAQTAEFNKAAAVFEEIDPEQWR